MTTEEKLELKEQMLDDTVALLRRIVRHNGAPISAKASLAEIANHVLDIDTGRVQKMWQDINTIDTVKELLSQNRIDRKPDLTTEELMGYGINDERLTAGTHSWAIVRITRHGTELITYGGDCFQQYKPVVTYEEVTEEVIDPDTGAVTTVTNTVSHVSTTEFTQDGDTELLLKHLSSQAAVWLADSWQADLRTMTLDTYTEGGETFYQVPCDLPGDLDKLIGIQIERSAVDGSGVALPLCYGLTGKSCNAQDGMLGLPHGIWLIYDNSGLASAPQALLIPKNLVDGIGYNYRFDRITITFNAEVSGLSRLRLVGDSFGDEYIVSTQDDTVTKGTWFE